MNKLILIKSETFFVSTSEPTVVDFDDQEGGMHFHFNLHYVDTEEQGGVKVISHGEWNVEVSINTVFYELMGMEPFLLGSYRNKEKLYFSWEIQPRMVDSRHKGTVTFYYEENSNAYSS